MGKLKQLDIELNHSDLHIKMDVTGRILSVNGLPIARPVKAGDITEVHRAPYSAYLLSTKSNKKKDTETQVDYGKLTNENAKTEVML